MTVAAHPDALARQDSCAIRTSSVKTVLRAQSPSCLSLAQTSCPALPSRSLAAFIVGPLGLGSPRLRAALRPAVLCVATTASVRPGRSAFDSLPVPWCDALVFVFLPACADFGSSAGRIARRMPGCCLSRSPIIRLLLPRRREALPSSRFTLLNTCPALRPRWSPGRSPCRDQDWCLPVTGCRRLSVRLPELIPCPRLYIFRSSMTRPVFSPYLCFAHRLSAIALRFGCRPGG